MQPGMLTASFVVLLLLIQVPAATSQEAASSASGSAASASEAGTPGDRPVVKVQIDRRTRRDASPDFAFPNVPAPSKSDAGNLAQITVVSGTADGNGAEPVALQDGRLPSQEDQPAANFFLAGRRPGRVLFDFGKPTEIRQIHSYSWHPGSRADQRFDVFVPTEGTDRDTAIASSQNELGPSWQKLAAVDTRRETSADAQIGVSIARADGKPLMTTQFVLLAIAPTDARSRFSQTFFSEIDFVDGQTHPAATTPEPAVVIDDLKIGPETVIHFDTTEVPELRDWVRSTLMPACQEWYPRITKALASEDYQAPSEFRIVFRKEMQGVAYTRGKNVFCAAAWYRANLKTEAVGSVIHELVHVVQQYGRVPRRQRPPGWLVEGIADHIRWYQFEPPAKRRRINWDRANYDDAYFASATFLDYIVRNVDDDAIRRINAACREGRYGEKFWVTLYGKSAEQLWADAKQQATDPSRN